MRETILLEGYSKSWRMQKAHVSIRCVSLQHSEHGMLLQHNQHDSSLQHSEHNVYLQHTEHDETYSLANAARTVGLWASLSRYVNTSLVIVLMLYKVLGQLLNKSSKPWKMADTQNLYIEKKWPEVQIYFNLIPKYVNSTRMTNIIITQQLTDQLTNVSFKINLTTPNYFFRDQCLSGNIYLWLSFSIV